MSFQNKIEYFVFISFVKIFSLIGINKARKFSVFLAFLFYYIIPVRKKVVYKNLSIAFPELSVQQLQELAYKAYKNICITLSEIFCLEDLSPGQIDSLFYIEKTDRMKESIIEKRGGILFTAHFGNWEMAAAAIGIKLGTPIHVVAKAQRNPYVTRWLNSMREQTGSKVVMLGVSIKNVFRELLKGNIIAIVGDQRGSAEGLRVDFFNRQTAVYNGAAMLAVKTGCLVFICPIIRQPDFSYKVLTTVIDPRQLDGSEEEKIKFITQKFMNILECTIKQYPEQWFWMHNIWKY